MDDLETRSLRELLSLARERLGTSASNLKTRDELIAALRQAAGEGAGPAGAPSPTPGSQGDSAEVVTRDFFLPRK